ncbi:MAG: cell division protein FtsA [Rhodobacteraceae bacterium]|nr:cell division protein FtsA [Paracoccaceae bacterium]MCY4138838.1 cell division protein FtsA [Paracoccaceae bacterium]
MPIQYQSQRLMRQRRKAALKRRRIAILDIGSTKIACMILQLSPELRSEPIGVRDAHAFYELYRVIGVATTRSRGIRFGEICTMDEAERAIRTAISGAQKMAQTRVDHVIACFSGGLPQSFSVSGRTELGGGSVTESDIGRVLGSCESPERNASREAIHAMPVNFQVDDRSELVDPRGLTGSHLSVDTHLLTIQGQALTNLQLCIRQCDLEIAGVAFAGYASGLASLVDDEREFGAVCVDLGGGSSTVSIFLKNHMIFADSVRLGGSHITSDISKGLQIPFEVSERIKTLHGGVTVTGADDREMIELVSSDDADRDYRRVSRAELIGVIKPRMEEILEEVRSRMENGGFGHLPSRRIVLTGGGSLLHGLDRLAARVLGQEVRLGRPLRIAGLPQAASGPAFSATVGLTLHTVLPQDECWDFHAPDLALDGLSFGNMVRWLRENW